MSTLAQDMRYGIRLLRKSPGFTAVAVAALALGIGANTAIFSVVNAVLLRPLPYPDAGRLAFLWESAPAHGWKRIPLSGPDYVDFKERGTSFEAMALMEPGSGTLSGDGEPQQVPGMRVTANFFDLLGAKPMLGRPFTRNEGWNDRVAILAHGAWLRLTGGDPSAIGRRVMADGLPYTIIGVMPPDLWIPLPSDVFVPYSDADLRQRGRMSHDLVAVTRLKPGVSYRQATAEAASIMRQIGETEPRMKAWTAALVPMREELVHNMRPTLMVLLAAVGLVLLIACANLANLLLARAAARNREIAIRTAMGARRSRLIRQFLTETLVLGFAGGVLGLLLAMWGVDGLERLLPPVIQLPDSHELVVRPRFFIDAQVLLFTLGVSVATSLLFGLAPAFAGSQVDLNAALKNGGRSTGGGHARRVRGALVVAEIALALVLLISAGLTMKSFLHLQHLNPGFTAGHVLAAETELTTDSRYRTGPEQAAFFRRVLENIATLPGVRSAGLTNALPLTADDPNTEFSIEGRPVPPSGQLLPMSYRRVSAGYFKTLGIPLLAGRAISEQDTLERPRVAVIDETFARLYWPAGVEGARTPIGQRLRVGRSTLEIVGIVGAVRNAGLDKDPRPTAYVSYLQAPDARMSILVRHPDPRGIVRAVKEAVYAVDRGQAVHKIRTMDEVVSGSQSASRFTLWMLCIFAFTALALASIGIYGVMSYAVAQRTGEIGIRVALGASAGDVLRLVVGQGMRLAACGLVLGLAGAVAASRLLASLLYGVSGTDPLVYAATAAVLAVVALAASYLPARRAAAIDPIVSLRYQ